MIKNRVRNIEHEEEIIYSSNSLDYFLTYDSNTGKVFCYGNQKLDLTHFLIPGITSKISAESGEFLLNSDIFKNIICLFDIDPAEIYFLLRIIDNSEELDNQSETLFLFSEKSDCIAFNSVLVEISLNSKITDINLFKSVI